MGERPVEVLVVSDGEGEGAAGGEGCGLEMYLGRGGVDGDGRAGGAG